MEDFLKLGIYTIITILRGIVFYFIWNYIATSMFCVGDISIWQAILGMLGISFIRMKVKWLQTE